MVDSTIHYEKYVKWTYLIFLDFRYFENSRSCINFIIEKVKVKCEETSRIKYDILISVKNLIFSLRVETFQVQQMWICTSRFAQFVIPFLEMIGANFGRSTSLKSAKNEQQASI